MYKQELKHAALFVAYKFSSAEWTAKHAKVQLTELLDWVKQNNGCWYFI